MIYEGLDILKHGQKRVESPIEKAFIHHFCDEEYAFLVDQADWQDWYRNCFRHEKAIIPQFKISRYRLDFAIIATDLLGRQVLLAIECDGHEWHSSPEARDRDNRRDKALRSIGWETLRMPGWRLHREPWECANMATVMIDYLKRAERNEPYMEDILKNGFRDKPLYEHEQDEASAIRQALTHGDAA